MELAGYSATPAEEMAAEDRPRAPEARTRSRPGTADAIRASIQDAALVKGIGGAALQAIAEEVGVQGGRATVAQLREIQAQVMAMPTTRQELEASGIGTENDPIAY